MRNLKCQLCEGKAGIFRAGTDPENALAIWRPVGVEPEAGCVYRFPCALEGQCPKSNVMALARAVIDRLLEADVLATSKKIERAEGAVG